MDKHFYIKTYGCQMNVYDSDAMANILDQIGWQKQNTPQQADLIILNTCHIRQKAADKIYSEVGRLKKLKAQDKPPIIAIAGCVAQAEGKALIQRQPNIDFVVGPQNFQHLPEMIALAERGRKSVATEFLTQEKFSQLKKPSKQKKPVSAFLTIQEGCDKFCSFCVVPYTRGYEVSRAPQDILAEAQNLARNGAKEIILLGQNVNAYRFHNWNLADLLAALAENTEILRLGYTTSHPLDMNQALIQAHRDNPKLNPFIHLPVQSGSDHILKKMNRKHQVKHYHDIVKQLRDSRKDIALSSDFICGFPEESEEDFQQTLKLVEAVQFAKAYSFKYSPRQGTKAAQLPQISETVKADRLARLQLLLDKQKNAFQQKWIGQKMQILVEQPHFGKTCYGQHIHLDKPCLPGAIIEAHISKASTHSLQGQIL